MINFKLLLKASEMLDFTQFIDGLFLKRSREISFIDFHNLRYFSKRLFDKNFKEQGSGNNKKKYTIPVNINVYSSLLNFYELNKTEIEHPSNTFYFVIYKDILLQLDKQRHNLMTINYSPINQ